MYALVRGKANSNVAFGSKIQVSLMQGYAFLDGLSWDAFNEGTRLLCTVEKYKSRFGYDPKEVLVDKIYCTRANSKSLKELDIKLHAKPLGRPKKREPYQVTAGERNPIEGKFGQAKTAYGHNRIKARLQQTSESWIATIVLVLNLVKLAKEAPLCIFLRKLSSSVKYLLSESIKLKTTEVHLLFLKLSNQQYLILKRSTF
jgi:IS5 family transposase